MPWGLKATHRREEADFFHEGYFRRTLLPMDLQYLVLKLRLHRFPRPRTPSGSPARTWALVDVREQQLLPTNVQCSPVHTTC